MHHLKTILVATDFSEKSDNAILRAVMLAKEYNAKLILLHVAQKNVLTKIIGKLLPKTKKIFISPKEHAEITLKNKIKELKKFNLKISSVVLSGHPGATILSFARKKKFDLIVMGIRGQYSINDWFIGTTTEMVSKKTKTPLLIVKKIAAKPYRHILVPIDFSESSRMALQFAMLTTKTELTAIHIASNEYETYLKNNKIDPKKLQFIKKDILKTLGDKTKKFIAPYNPTLRPITHQVIVGYPSIEIIKKSNKTHTDLIIMGTSGHSQQHYILLGRVATRVLYEVSTDVLLIPPKK